MKQAIGVDIGGTKIAVAAISVTGEIRHRISVESDTESAETMYQSVTNAIDQFLVTTKTSIADYQGIGVGVPGKVDQQAGVAVFQNNLPWAEFPIVGRLKETYGDCQIVIDNDVYQAAYAEWQASGVTDEDIFIYYTISTGIACSIIKGGNFIRGSGFAGEAGLIPVVDLRDGQKVQRLELLASGPALVKEGIKRYQEDHLTTAELFERYHQGDQIAEQLIQEMIEALSHSIYGIISLLDPGQIVFGGSVSMYQPFLIDRIKERLGKYVIPAQEQAIKGLGVSQLDNNAGIIGAGLQVFR